WDRPSKENEKRCVAFFPSSPRLSLKYRMFMPEPEERSVPLVIFLHGADAFGSDNCDQIAMHDVATMFAADEWQAEHRCYVVCPQCRRGKHWSMPEMVEEVLKMIDFVTERAAATNISVDETRLYLYGYSAGAVGVMEILKKCPERFAGAISICGATGRNDIDNLTNTPLWLVHAADDRIVKASYVEDDPKVSPYYLGSRDIYEKYGSTGPAEMKYTEFPVGYMHDTYGVNPHCSWVCVSGQEGKPMREWLFGLRR
ncbi:MAG: hypothetical protein IK096_07075, partial [Lachnospiraceae bacterium]|nr:hypothetical protein [Lachnospiraceae bacterium]